MQKLSECYEENLAYFKTLLKPGENFDLICREIQIGKDAATALLCERFEPIEKFYRGKLILNSEEESEQYLQSVSLTEK